MAFYVVQFLTGLASAASLFLVASGLSIIFGVTRIVVTIPGTASIFSENSGTKKLWTTSSDRSS